MTMQTKLSAKGQVVIPKDVRDRLGLTAGTVLEVIEAGDDVILRIPSHRQTLSVEEASRVLEEKVHYKGPPLPLERLSWSAEVDRASKKRRSK